MRTDDPNACVKCGDPLVALLVVSSLALLFALAIAGYVYLISTNPAALPHVVSTASIVISHFQTLAILGSLRLAWPESARKVISAFGLAGLDLAALDIDAARPECLLASRGSEGFFHIFNIVMLGCVLSVLFALNLVKLLVALYLYSRRGASQIVRLSAGIGSRISRTSFASRASRSSAASRTSHLSYPSRNGASVRVSERPLPSASGGEGGDAADAAEGRGGASVRFAMSTADTDPDTGPRESANSSCSGSSPCYSGSHPSSREGAPLRAAKSQTTPEGASRRPWLQLVERGLDRLFIAETIAFQITLIASWQVAQCLAQL